MLRITTQRSSAQVKSYYERSDYYEEGPSALKGYWYGKGAEKLGLSGAVIKEHFDRIADNQHPYLDESLTPRTRADRRVGWDFTFSVSKSVSIMWALTQDHRILDVIRESVNETLAEIESDVLTRVHVGEQMHTEKTDNIVAATWLHATSRPVNGVVMPGLHVHAWLANATFFGDRFKAMDISGVKKDGPYYEARFHSRLAAKLNKHFNLPIERQGKKWFEVKGVSRDIVELYSERLKQIEKVARQKGIVDVEQKAELGARTRESKLSNVAPEVLPRVWRDMLTDDQFHELFTRIKQATDEQVVPAPVSSAVDHAIAHRFEGQSTVRERELMTDAIWRGIGINTVEEIEGEFAKRDFIRDGKDEAAWVTTPEVLREERWLLHFARSGRGRDTPLAPNRAVEREWLSDEQKSAAQKLWQSADRVMVLAGKAGTGKTTLAQEVVAGIEQNSHSVIMVAPTTKAVDVLSEEGFDAHTLAKLLGNKDLQASARGQVIWVDEAGLVSSVDMAKLFRTAEELNARVILAGDVYQHSPISRGRPLELLEREAGIKPITITQIRRQQDDAYRMAVEKLSRGNIEDGFDALEKLGAFKVFTNETRDKALAKSYADAIDAGQSTLVIAPSRAEKEVVTQAIREELRARGRLDSNEHDVVTLKPYGWTQAERKDARLYSAGDVIEFHARGKGGFMPGDRVEVTTVTDTQVMTNRNGLNVPLPMQSAAAFAVFRPVKQAFAKGDTIKITQNRRAKPGQQRLTNGHRHTIAGFAPNGDLLLANGVKVNATWGHIEHGVVSTSYSSQGDTKDKVIIAQSAISFGASSPQQLYVSASRGRAKNGLEIFTDDLAGLKRATSHDRSVMSATELASKAVTPQPNEAVKSRISTLRHIAVRTHEYLQEHIKKLRDILPTPTLPAPAR